MTGKREAKREGLRARLIAAASQRIEASGLKGLRARDVTADAGCALGGLYTVFEDLDDLVMHVNSVTLARLGDELEKVAATEADPCERSVLVALGYLHFAEGNRNLWNALFDHRMPEGETVPDWHLADHAVLFRHIVEPLKAHHPDMPPDELDIRARAVFGAIHGIISISLQDRFIGVPREKLEWSLRRFVQTLVMGLAQT